LRELPAWYDKSNSFGWISIGLHWGTALLIIVLWFVGMSIMYQSADAIDARRSLHITLGLMAWIPLAIRIGWRVVSGHPQVNGQSAATHRLAKFAHYVMLATLTISLLTGPLMAWLLPERTAVVQMALLFHSTAAKVLAGLVLLHVAAAMKHLMFHDDETIARIFVPK
jgi:cytochrome b561